MCASFIKSLRCLAIVLPMMQAQHVRFVSPSEEHSYFGDDVPVELALSGFNVPSVSSLIMLFVTLRPKSHRMEEFASPCKDLLILRRRAFCRSHSCLLVVLR